MTTAQKSTIAEHAIRASEHRVANAIIAGIYAKEAGMKLVPIDAITSAGPLHPDEQISGSDSPQIAGAAKHSAEPVTTPRTGEAVAPVAGMPVPGAEIQPVPAGAEATPTVPAPARQSRVLHPKRRASAK